ncbi:MAG: TIGR03986 family CRISPR-associated RAMP protein [Anaerolineae bacterium]|nr:TIGR03986 family CRISPR-associated RAMP protein [Anaerolineae bacterium]
MNNRDSQGRRIEPAKRARAPYNFIPLQDRIVPAEELPDHNRFYDNRRTGHFDVTLITDTPLYIRGMLTETEATARTENRDKSDFFQLQGKPIVPGSSLRGMLRSLVEIVAFGKIQPVTDKRLVYRAVGDTTSYGLSYREMMLGPAKDGVVDYPTRNLRGGYLERNGHEWAIRPAKSFHNETFVFVETDQLQDANIPEKPQDVVDVWVEPVPSRRSHPVQKEASINVATSPRLSRTQQPGLEPGTLVISGKAPKRKRYPVIFSPDHEQPLIRIPREMWDVYEADRDMQRGIRTRPLREVGNPLFYLLDAKGELVFFGPTIMFRLPPRYSIRDLIPPALKEDGIADIAEAMFGYVDKRSQGTKQGDKARAYASRVTVSDAHPLDGQSDFFEKRFRPKILGSPKPTTFQHYLDQRDGERTAKENLSHYAHGNARLRGHKLYWRQRGITVSDVEEKGQVAPGDRQHTWMRPVRPGVSFSFRVQFENLSDVELGALAWALTLPGSDQHRHQLGMGKPYGMGVVKLDARLFLGKRVSRYSRLFDGSDWLTAEAEAIPDEYIRRFERHVCDALSWTGEFRELGRIRELRTMLTAQAKALDFSYMDILDFKKRPVLPKPSEVLSRSGAQRASLPASPALASSRPIPPPPGAAPRGPAVKARPEIGNVVKGEVFSVDNGISFSPEGYDGYEAHIPHILRQRKPGDPVKGRVIEIRDGDPITLICEQIDTSKKR